MTTTTAPAATIRFITVDNADSLGYGDADFDEDGMWVLEDHDGEWLADFRDIDETDIEAAKAAAEDHLSEVGTWRRVVANYGTAYQLLVN